MCALSAVRTRAQRIGKRGCRDDCRLRGNALYESSSLIEISDEALQASLTVMLEDLMRSNPQRRSLSILAPLSLPAGKVRSLRK